MGRHAWILAACLGACTQAHVSHEEQRAVLDPPATFGGRIPCSDCPDIEMTLELTADSSYRLRRTHVQAIAGMDTSSVETGRWSFDEEGRLLLVNGNDALRFEVLADTLRGVHPTGDDEENAPPQHYGLFRVQQSVLDTHWRLVEVEGRAVTALPGQPEPYIELSGDSQRVTGSGGCNGFGGPWVAEGERLSIGPLVLTRMACAQGMATEQAFVRALVSTDRFTIDAGLLMLHAGDTLVARLQARHGG